MNILFLSTKDPRQHPDVWSGLPKSMLEGFEALGHTVHVETIDANSLRYYVAVKWRFYRWVLRQNYLTDFDPVFRWFARRRLKKRLGGVSFDLVFTWLPWFLLLIETDKPRVYWYDTTFIRTRPMYYANLCAESTRDGIKLDGQIAREAAAATYPSEWARDSAVNDYGADPRHVHFIPFGANLEAPPEETVNQAIEGRFTRTGIMRLLFVGLDWERKGGSTAVEVTREINRRGVPARLTVVGCRPEINAEDAKFVEVVGKLDKSRPNELARMRSLYLESDFFLMPSHAESLGIVYCEAMASGCPSLAAETGGVGTVVRNDLTGHLAPWGPGIVAELAEYAIQVRGDIPRYRALCASCRRVFESEFVWRVSWDRLRQVLESLGIHGPAGSP
jgi:glycosyltransferase involved in cell wall biosynthesis